MSPRIETQESISTWAAETFGPVGSDFRVATRANEEMAELLRAIGADAGVDKIATEIADVMIVLYRLADRLGDDLDHPTHRRESVRLADRLGDEGVGPVLRSGVHASNTDTLASAAYFVTRANRKLAILLTDLAKTTTAHMFVMLDVCADVARDLHKLAAVLGVDLFDAIDKKMAINRARVWNLDGTGHGYHVRDRSSAP